MKTTKKVYVLIQDIASDYESDMYTRGVFTSKDAAINELQRIKWNDLSNLDGWEHDAYDKWKHSEDRNECEWQVSEDRCYYFDIWLDGNNAQYHNTLRIDECELTED